MVVYHLSFAQKNRQNTATRIIAGFGYPTATDSVSNVFREHTPRLGGCIEVECKFHTPDEDFVDRMEDELNELTERIQKLDTFIQTDTYRNLTQTEKDLLIKQFKAMECYRDNLYDRLHFHYKSFK